MSKTEGHVDHDVKRLAELGYKQELTRAWSSFTNFAISFTIISVLAGCFTNFSFAWSAGGPAAIAIGWPVLCAFVLLVAVSMSELTSAFPTAGGPYWWAAKLGGNGWSWFTGWFNIVGLVGIVAGVGYGAAIFLNAVLSLYGVKIGGIDFATANPSAVLHHTFVLFLLIVVFYTVVNIFADRLLGLFNNISVGWHVLGVLVIIGILVFVPDHHQNAGFVFGHTLNNTGFHGGSTGGAFFWLYVLPIGFILTMYTQTGYDASAHTAEETRDAAIGAAKGVWKSVFFSAIAGWFVLLAFLFAASDTKAINAAGGSSISIFTSAMANHIWAAKMVLIVATVGQLFCGAAGLTSASRTWYAFSRDRGMPGWWLFRRLNQARVPLYAVVAVSVASLIITIPAYWGNKVGVPWAYYAITAICTVGLYLAYIIPVYLRLRQGDNFQPGPWNLGRHYKWINIGAIVFVVLVVFALDIPIVPGGVPWKDDFTWTSVNYSPLVLVVGILVAIWWQVSAKNKYTGPVRTIDEPVGTEEAPEAGPAPAPGS
ncbi:MAG: amino acid permease [Actinomycetota bacterium]|nr:amino acid permease [Actinomycetota bacterium]MDQ2981122.1 amino acid permease [Actinomycetota bacterium]